MKTVSIRFRRTVALCIVLAATGFASAATVEGRWRLVEQSPGGGRTEHAAGTPALRLSIVRAGDGIRGEVWIAGSEGGRVEWPALFRDGEPVPVRLVERGPSAASERLFARYEARDPAEPDRVVEIIEDYRLVESGSALVGTVTVRPLQGDDAGEHVLRRRFERER